MAPPDQVRHHRARQEIHTERDRLLKQADRRTDLDKYRPSDSKDRARATLLAAGLVLGGFSSYAVMILMWFLVYHDSFRYLVVVFLLLIVSAGLMCVASHKRALGKERPWLAWLGVLFSQAAVVGLVVGFFLYFRLLCYYLKYEEMRTYTNVAAAEQAAAYSDGSMFLFTEDTRLDPMRAVGFKSRWTGETYCVAPVVDSTMNQAHDIYYWAIGVDCCNPRAEFHCDDAAETVQSALVVLEPEDVVRPFMTWAVQGTAYPRYMEAIRLQEATYNTKAALQPKFVRWSKDPIALKESYYNSARTICTWVSLVYFALMAVVTYQIAWRLIPKQRAEGVIRHH